MIRKVDNDTLPNMPDQARIRGFSEEQQQRRLCSLNVVRRVFRF